MNQGLANQSEQAAAAMARQAQCDNEGGAIVQVRKLTAENAELTAKLESAQKTINAFATTISVLTRMMHP